MGKGGGTTETTQEPWGGQQPYLKRGFEEAWRNFQSGGPEFYPGATYVPFSGQTEQGLGMMQNRALAGLGGAGAGAGGGANMYSAAPQNNFDQDAYNAAEAQWREQYGWQPGQGPMSTEAKNALDAIQQQHGYGGHTMQGGMGGGSGFLGADVERGMQDRVLQGMNEGIGGGFQQNYLQNQMQQDPRYFGGQAPGYAQNAFSQAGQQMAPFTQQSQLGGVAGQQLNRNMQGSYLNGNPHMDAMYGHAAKQVTDQFQNAVMPGINATFGAAGRTGSNLHGQVAGDAAGELGESLQGMAASLYGGNYQQERDRQMQALGLGAQQDLSRYGLSQDAAGQYGSQQLMGAQAGASDDLSRRGMNQQGYQFQNQLGQSGAQALNQLGMMNQQAQQGWAGMAPTAAGFDYNNINNMMKVGGAVEGKAGEVLQDDMARFNHYQNQPEQNLANYMASIMGNYGGTTEQKQPGTPGWMQALGGAQMLASILGPQGFNIFGKD